MSIPSYLNSDLYPPYKYMHFGQPIQTSYLAGLRKVWYCLGMQGLATLSQQRNQGTWEPPIGRGENPSDSHIGSGLWRAVTSQTLPVNVCSFAHISNHDHPPIQTNDRFWGKQKCNCCGLVCTNQIFIKCMSAKHCIKFPYRFLLPFIPSKYIFNANLHQTYL